MKQDIFQAIADPTRRQIMNLLVHESMNLNAIAEQFDISRPAISKHIKILTGCGLVIVKQQGRERFCYPELGKLEEVSKWIKHLEKFWDHKLNALKKHLENE
jgi:DNA-binding transcriptional ArsR family regulator